MVINHIEEPLENALVSQNDIQPRGKERRRRLKRSLRLLPNIFTLGNAFLGFCAIVLAAQKHPSAAAYCILLGASFDALDGRIARLTNSTSPLGMQLDSLSDAVTFCLAPACMMYMGDFGDGDVFAFFGSAFFLLSGVFRLARFNISSQTQASYFIGLPTTIAGCCLAVTTLIFPLQDYNQLIGPMLMVLGYLMISRLRFPTFKQASKRGILTSIILGSVITLTFGFHKTFFVFALVYLAMGLIYTIQHKRMRTLVR